MPHLIGKIYKFDNCFTFMVSLLLPVWPMGQPYFYFLVFTVVVSNFIVRVIIFCRIV